LVFKVPEESNPDRDYKKLGKLPPEYFVFRTHHQAIKYG
jgi:hypothetical protein